MWKTKTLRQTPCKKTWPPQSTVNAFFHQSTNSTLFSSINATTDQIRKHELCYKTRTAGKICLDDHVQTCSALSTSHPGDPVPESVGGRGGFRVEFGHWHAAGWHLGGKHGRGIDHGGSPDLQSRQTDVHKWPHGGEAASLQKTLRKLGPVCGCWCEGR